MLTIDAKGVEINSALLREALQKLGMLRGYPFSTIVRIHPLQEYRLEDIGLCVSLGWGNDGNGGNEVSIAGSIRLISDAQFVQDCIRFERNYEVVLSIVNLGTSHATAKENTTTA